MFQSLRTRLWLTYAVLAGTVLLLVFSGLVLIFLRSPLVDRASYLRLDVILAEMVNRQTAEDMLDRPALSPALQRAAASLDVRLILLDDQGGVVLDTGANAAPALGLSPRLLRNNQGLVGDRQQGIWLYAQRDLPGGGMLVAAIPRPPRLQTVQRIFGQDSLLNPFFQAAAVALFLSLLLAAGIARWVSNPLRRMAKAAREVAQRTAAGSFTGQPGSLHVEVAGPREVEELARAFNDMSDQVLSSQRAQRDFVANVSHELKTPLTSIQGFAQALTDETAESPEKRTQAAQIISSEARRMERLVQELLELARFDAGTIALQMRPQNICELLQVVLARFAPQAQAASVQVELSCGNLPEMFLDGDRMIQVFGNLLDNAIKFSPNGGTVRISATIESGAVVIRFMDEGPGIPPEDLPRIFERFYQVDKARRGGGVRGSGLGLAIAREIVSAHGGLLAVEPSSAQGACFVVKLPSAAAPAPGKSPPSA